MALFFVIRLSCWCFCQILLGNLAMGKLSETIISKTVINHSGNLANNGQTNQNRQKPPVTQLLPNYQKRPQHQYASYLLHPEHGDSAKHQLARFDAPPAVMRQSQYPAKQKCLMAQYAGSRQSLYCKARTYHRKTLRSSFSTPDVPNGQSSSLNRGTTGPFFVNCRSSRKCTLLEQMWLWRRNCLRI